MLRNYSRNFGCIAVIVDIVGAVVAVVVMFFLLVLWLEALLFLCWLFFSIEAGCCG